jgi:hypothetical protein
MLLKVYVPFVYLLLGVGGGKCWIIIGLKSIPSLGSIFNLGYASFDKVISLGGKVAFYFLDAQISMVL